MANVFSGLQQQTPPQGNPQDDVKTAIEQLIAQQQAGEEQPRPPTPEEGEQIKQLGMQMMQQKGMGGPKGQPGAQGVPGQPDQPSPTYGGAAFMGQGGMNPALAQQQTAPDPAPKPSDGQGSGFNLSNAIDLSLKTNPATAIPYVAGNVAEKMNPSNAVDLMMKTNPATAIQYMAVKNADPKMLETGKKAANIVGDVAGSGKIFSDERKPLKPAAPAEPISEDQGPQEPTPSEADEGDQIKPKGEIGTPEHEAHLAKVVAPQAREVADALTKSGVDSPDKADIALRAKYHDDPDLEKAISEARETYNQLRELNNQPPTVTQYIGAILLGLVGASPHVISNILHPGQALNAQREGMAGESLMKLQLAKAANRGRQIDINAKQGEDSMAQKRLDQQKEIFEQREGDQNKHQKSVEMRASLEKARDHAASMARHYADLAANKTVGEEKKKNIKLAEEYRQQSEGFGGMLGEPSLNQMKQMQQKSQPQKPGGPQSMAPQGQVSPSAMRLLGIGNA